MTQYPHHPVVAWSYQLSVATAAFIVVGLIDRRNPDVLVIAAAWVRVFMDNRSVSMAAHNMRSMVVIVSVVGTEDEIRISVVHVYIA